MNNDYSFKRHSAMWEAQNKLIKKVYVAGFLLAYLLLTNILTPYSRSLDKIKSQTEERSAKVKEIEASIQNRNALGDTLQAIQRIIGRQPWMKEKQKLIDKFAEMNREGGADLSLYQKEADSTITLIGDEVLQHVSKPLQQFQTDVLYSQYLSVLKRKIDALPQVVEQWKRKNIGRNWYHTVSEKGITIDLLTSDLKDWLQDIANQINNEIPALQRKADQLKAQIAQLEQQKLEAEKKLPEELDEEMRKILPGWFNGIISEKQLMLYPFLILGFAIYVVALAYTLTYHFHFMAAGLDIEKEENKDAALSSLWTLTLRGRVGTALTLGVYLVLILAMWYFYEAGFDIFIKWQNTQPKSLFGADMLSLIRWLGRFILLVLAVAVARRPFQNVTT